MRKLFPYLLLSLFLLPAMVLAQDKSEKEEKPEKVFPLPKKNTLTVSLGGGSGEILVNGRLGKPSILGGAVGLDVCYTQALSPCWGLQVGLGFHYLTGGFSANGQATDYTASIPVTNGGGYHDENAHFVCKLDGIHEFYTMPMFQIPIRVTFVKNQWCAAGGIKLGVPLNMTAKYDYSECVVGINEVTGTGTVLDDFLPLYSFDPVKGDYNVCGVSGSSFGSLLSVAASFEVGYRFTFNKKEALVVGLYADYGLNKIHAGCEQEEPFLTVHDGKPIYSNCMQSDLISGFRYLSAGVKMTYQCGYGREAGYHDPRHHKPLNLFNLRSSTPRSGHRHPFRRSGRRSLW